MGKKSRDALTQLGYGMGYFHYYRNLLADSLNLAHRKVSEIYSEYTEDQQECISIMLELDMINNSVMYCMDFAAVLLSIQRPDKGLIRMISSIHETGSGSIKEFYDNVNDQPFEYFWNIMGYEKRKINKNDLPRYRRSCNRFIDDIRKMSEFFLKYYPIFSCYKHRLNVIPVKVEDRGRLAFQLGNPDGSFDHIEFPLNWFLISYEINEIIFRMFDRLVVPQISWVILEQFGVDLETEYLKATINSHEPYDPKRPLKVTMKLNYPWKIYDAKKPDPFYYQH